MRVCVWACILFKPGTLGTDAPIISLISGMHSGDQTAAIIFSVNLAYSAMPRDTSIFSSMWDILVFFARY